MLKTKNLNFINKITFKISVAIWAFLVIFLIIYPHIELNLNSKIIKFSYSGDFSEFETNSCYSESYFYNEERDVSIYEFDSKNFLFFYVITLNYKEGNVCDTEYLLEEEYIDNFLENAFIKYNTNNIDIAKLIEGRTAIEGNVRYSGNDYMNSIGYILDDKHEELYVFYVEDLLIIQVGLSDEGPKFIAYK